MKTLATRVVLLTLSLVVAFPMSALAQSAPAGTRVAVIDISYIFKNHPGFKASMEEMKKEVEAFEGTLRERGKQIKTLQEKMQQYNPTSAEYKQTEAEILKIQGDGQAAATLKKKDFLQRESRIYYNTYNEVVNDVAQFSEQHGISLVVRFNSEKVNPDDRGSVLEGVNRAVVYQKNLNITFAILERLKRSSMAQQPAATAPTKR